jgi:hypothetical protein
MVVAEVVTAVEAVAADTPLLDHLLALQAEVMVEVDQVAPSVGLPKFQLPPQEIP